MKITKEHFQGFLMAIAMVSLIKLLYWHFDSEVMDVYMTSLLVTIIIWFGTLIDFD